jgi:hypothetical protein
MIDEDTSETNKGYQESGAVPIDLELNKWKEPKWLQITFPFQKGKGRCQPPFEILKGLENDNQRADAVLRWRGLTSEEQWTERETTLGHRRPIARKKTSKAKFCTCH